MRVLVVVNEKAGGGDSGLFDFVRYLGVEGMEVVLRYASADRRAENLVADASDFDRVVAAGGDGTASAVSYSMRGSGVPILVYPAGTANLLAQNLGMPTDPPALSDVLLTGVPVGFDLGELQQEQPDGTIRRSGFAIMAGAGYDATIVQAADPLKPALGPVAYLAAAVSNPIPTAARFELVLDGEHVSTDGIAVLLLNFARIQFDLAVTPNSDPRDGMLEVAVIRSKNVVGLLPAVAAAVLDRVGNFPDRSPSLELFSASTVEVSAYPPLRMQADGDAIEALTPFRAMVLNGAATLLVPAKSRYAAPLLQAGASDGINAERLEP